MNARNHRDELVAQAARERYFCGGAMCRHSKAMHSSVHPAFGAHNPPGFDHTRIFYQHQFRFHFLLTEPYHDENVEIVVTHLEELNQNESSKILYSLGKKGGGLHNPGWCYPVVIASSKKTSQQTIDYIASWLPHPDDVSPAQLLEFFQPFNLQGWAETRKSMERP